MANSGSNQDTTGKGLLNDYIIRPTNITQYTAFRGITDYTNIGQFQQFESGYSFLSVLQMPKFITMNTDKAVQDMCNSFKHMLEFEFRGLEGLPDMNSETMSITDGINTQNLINKVTQDTAVTVSSNYFEKRGSLITRFSEFYLTGIKDRMTQAKTYHGLIRSGILDPSPENEVFTMLYYVTDNTMLALEKAVLLCNMQLTKAETSMYNSQKGEYNNKEMSVEWTCFPVTGYYVDMAARALLTDITGAYYDPTRSGTHYAENNSVKDAIHLDSYSYRYGIMRDDNSTTINGTNVQNNSLKELTNAINGVSGSVGGLPTNN